MIENDITAYERLRKVVSRTFGINCKLVTPELARGQVPGWDSLGHLTLMMEIEKAFLVRFSTEQLAQAKTFDELWKLVSQVRPTA